MTLRPCSVHALFLYLIVLLQRHIKIVQRKLPERPSVDEKGRDGQARTDRGREEGTSLI